MKAREHRERIAKVLNVPVDSVDISPGARLERLERDATDLHEQRRREMAMMQQMSNTNCISQLANVAALKGRELHFVESECFGDSDSENE